MAAVKDTQGNEWIVSLNTSTILRIREQAGIDLLKIQDDRSVMSGLFGDLEVQMKVLYWTCQTQVQTKFEKPLSYEAWCDLWDGTALEAGLHELLEALARFFPPQKGEALRKGVAATQEFVNKLFQRSQKLAEGISGEMTDRLLDKTEQQILQTLEADLGIQQKVPDPPETAAAEKDGGTSSGDAQASSESTQAHSQPPNSSR